MKPGETQTKKREYPCAKVNRGGICSVFMFVMDFLSDFCGSTMRSVAACAHFTFSSDLFIYVFIIFCQSDIIKRPTSCYST